MSAPLLPDAPAVELVLDANVLIAAQNPAEPHQDEALSLLDEGAAMRWRLHPLTRTELLVLPARVGGAEAARGYARSLLSFGIEPEPGCPAADLADPDAQIELATLRAEIGLRLPDAAVLHLVISLGAALATRDTRLARAADERGVEVLRGRPS